MKKTHVVGLGLVVVVAAAAVVSAQRQGRGFGGLGLGMLLMQKSVQEELKLTEEQTKKIAELTEKQTEALKDVPRQDRRKKADELNKANEKTFVEMLKPEQFKRLKQISLQRRGLVAVAEPEVAAALKLTDEQKEKVKALQEEQRQQRGELFKGGNSEEGRKKMAELRKSSEEKFAGLLTDEQKAKWKELAGEPFKGEIRIGDRPRGGNRRSKGN